MIYARPSSLQSSFSVDDDEQREQMQFMDQERIRGEVYEMIRDASSSETARAIQDSESNVAKEQKRMINTLIGKGWSKNEVVYEIQRVYGNDVLILQDKLTDDRPFHKKHLFSFLVISSLTSLALWRRHRSLR
eukprot:CAMPEP_0170555198 /NCGR_PEP_ID=MMETSP0211-20121228/13091_1 /TAXON_ID=311385 /ORGANISM="Pseudokeronopsis sp., Strain OXSARD2" /LENGTH=132 /DNA_ID=CAMNT_0010864863 /DNA_START=64 /DNA_END=462 /DNA_ORIENTATION=+